MAATRQRITIKLEDRTEIDSLVILPPIHYAPFSVVYSKLKPLQKLEMLPRKNFMGWAKTMTSNVFLAYFAVKKNRDRNNKPLPDDEHIIEYHEVPRLIASQYFNKIKLPVLLKTNNTDTTKVYEGRLAHDITTDSLQLEQIRLSKERKRGKGDESSTTTPKGEVTSKVLAAAATGEQLTIKIPLVPTYLYIQKRAFLKWKDTITSWWARYRQTYISKLTNTSFITKEFSRRHLGFRELQQGKQWLIKVITDYEREHKNDMNDGDRDEKKTSSSTKSSSIIESLPFVKPETERVSDKIREERMLQKKLKEQAERDQNRPKDKYDEDSDSDSDDSDSDSADDSNSSTNEDVRPTKQQKQSVEKKSTTKTKAPPSSSSSSSSDSDSSDDDDDEAPAPPSKSAKTTTNQSKTVKSMTQSGAVVRRRNFDDSESDSDSDSDSDSEEPLPPPKKTKKSTKEDKKTVKQPEKSTKASKSSSESAKPSATRRNFDDSDSDSDSDDDSSSDDKEKKIVHKNKKLRR